MTQMQRLEWLIDYLMAERPDIRLKDRPEGEQEAFDIFRALVNMRMPEPVSARFLSIQDEYLQTLRAQRGVVDADSLEFRDGVALWRGDITRLAAGAIVNAANSQLLGCFHPLHNCIDNCIHTYAGVQLRAECSRIMQAQGHEEPTGHAKITAAYNLPAKFVVHTVGPIVENGLEPEHERLLADCYRRCMDIAAHNDCKTLAFCCISTGVFGFPNARAAEIAVDTVKEHRPQGMRVIFNVFKEYDAELYGKLLGAEG